MKELFHELVRVGDKRSVAVEELPGGSYGIRGTIYNGSTGDIGNSAIRFSPEAIEVLTDILLRLREAKEEGKDE